MFLNSVHVIYFTDAKQADFKIINFKVNICLFNLFITYIYIYIYTLCIQNILTLHYAIQNNIDKYIAVDKNNLNVH